MMSPLEKVKNRVPIQNMLTFCHVTLSIKMSTKIDIYDVTTEIEYSM